MSEVVVQRVACDTCGERRVVMVTESIAIGKRRVTWVLCSCCWRKEQKEH